MDPARIDDLTIEAIGPDLIDNWHVVVTHGDAEVFRSLPMSPGEAGNVRYTLAFDVEFTECSCGKRARQITDIAYDDGEIKTWGWCEALVGSCS